MKAGMMNHRPNEYGQRGGGGGSWPKEPERKRIILDDYNSEINFVVGQDGVTGSSLYKQGFEYLWAGARTTHGVSKGKVCYEVLVKEKLEVEKSETDKAVHVVRVGWSTDTSSFALGEEPLSYGYGGTGKMSCNNKFNPYGEPFSTDDIITCHIDLDAIPKTVFFAKNGNYLGVAFKLGPEADGQVFYPCVSVKNMKFVANFGGVKPYFPPVQGFCFPELLPPHLLTSPPAGPKEHQDCEILMMVGLPSCGKTTWLEKFVKDHPEKKYNVLGTNAILSKMKVMGLRRKRNYHGRWDALIKQASGVLNEMLKVAQHKKRHYILDQTNVYPNARRRKMNNFRGYRHIAVVIVNSNLVLKQRSDKVVRENGKAVPESSIMEMKANFTLPVEGEIFDEVWYVEETQERSQQLVKEFNEEARAYKEGQKKRPADDPQKSEKPNPGMKKPRYQGATNPNNLTSQYGGAYHGNQNPEAFDAVDNARNMANTATNYPSRETGGFKPSDFGEGNFDHAKREYSSHHKQSNFSGPPPSHPSYHEPFSRKNDGYPNQHVSSAEDWQQMNAHAYQQPSSAVGKPYYSEDHQQNHGQHQQNHGQHQQNHGQHQQNHGQHQQNHGQHQQNHGQHQQNHGQHQQNQPQLQQPYHSQRTPYDNSSPYYHNHGNEAGDRSAAQMPSYNDQSQSYYANRQQPFPVKQENKMQDQSYTYNQQYQ